VTNATTPRRQAGINRERKCANTTGTVLVPWAGHFQYQKYMFQTKYLEAILLETVMV